MDHGEQVSPVGHQRLGVFQGDAANYADRQVQALAGLGQHVNGGGGCAGFGRGIEEAAEGDVAGAFFGGLFGQFDLAVAGGADDRLGAEQCPGRGQRAVGLTQMYADGPLTSSLMIN